MLTTENFARTQACPLQSDGTARIPCVATGCMAWRWAEYTPGAGEPRIQECEDAKATAEPDRPGYVPDSWVFVPYSETQPEYAFEGTENEIAHWAEPQSEAAARAQEGRKGYCGAFGAPTYA